MMNNAKTKIVMFLQSGVGGAERMTVLYGKTLPQSQFEVKFYPVAKGGVGNDNISEFIPHGYEIYTIYPKNGLNLCRTIYRIIVDEKPDYVFSSVLYLNDKLLLFRKCFPKTRFIIRCENYWYTFTKKQQSIIRLLYRRADLIVAQTQEMKDELVSFTNIPSHKIRVLENPVDTVTIDDKMRGSTNPYPADNSRHYVAVGRFSYQKGFDLLVDAFAMLLKEQGNANLYIVGTYDGASREQYEAVCEKVEKYNIKEKVHFLGYQSNPYPYIKYADAFVLSSRWEGLPNVLLEAMYLGTPVAAFKCIPFVERVVAYGLNGYCVENGDLRALAAAMIDAGVIGRCKYDYEGTSPNDIEALFMQS